MKQLVTYTLYEAGVGEPCMKSGLGIHMYACNKSMINRAYCSADGDMLVGKSRLPFVFSQKLTIMHLHSFSPLFGTVGTKNNNFSS